MHPVTQEQLDNLLSRLEKKSLPFINEVLKEVGKQSLFIFAKYILGYKDMTLDTHGAICDSLENDLKRKMIVVPRGCFKSSLCSIAYPLWMIIKDPNMRILIDSEVYSNAKNFLREIKLHILSDRFQNIYGNLRGETWNESEIIVSNRTRIVKEPSIAVSGIGAEKTSTHWDVIIADDLNSETNTRNPDVAEQVITHYKYYVSLLELDPAGTIVIVGTRYAELDLIGHILREEIGLDENAIAR